jgi:hypothetical protein
MNPARRDSGRYPADKIDGRFMWVQPNLHTAL